MVNYNTLMIILALAFAMAGCAAPQQDGNGELATIVKPAPTPSATVPLDCTPAYENGWDKGYKEGYQTGFLAGHKRAKDHEDDDKHEHRGRRDHN